MNHHGRFALDGSFAAALFRTLHRLALRSGRKISGSHGAAVDGLRLHRNLPVVGVLKAEKIGDLA